MSTSEELKKYSQETIDTVEGFCLFDDNFMSLVFERNIEATELLLNIILERDDMKVTEVVGQREYKNPEYGGRSIRVDIYAKDSAGKVYDVEVQRSDAGADVHRARFNSSMLDTRMLKAQQNFKEMHESYVIFITENDVMGDGLPLYHIDRVIRENGKSFQDGSHIIYVNGSYKNDEDPVGRLMHDFGCRRASDMFYTELANQVKYYKETEGGREIMCKAVDDLAENRRLDSLAECIKNLMETMTLTLEEAMNALKVTEADRKVLSKRL